MNDLQAAWRVLFDWDSVVMDSSSQHERSRACLAAERGLLLPKGHFKGGFEKKNEIIIPWLIWSDDSLVIQELADRKEALYRELIAAKGVIILSGARELLAALKKEGLPHAIGSFTPRENLNAIFAVTGLDAYFDAVVCGSDVTHGKLDPEVFLKGATKLGLPAHRCIVIEGAFAGIEAAHRAGMKVVGVATTNPLEELQRCNLAVISLVEVTPLSLSDLL